MLSQNERVQLVEEIAEKIADLLDTSTILKNKVNPHESVVTNMARAAFFVAEAFVMGKEYDK